jgi:hypothetical protein
VLFYGCRIRALIEGFYRTTFNAIRAFKSTQIMLADVTLLTAFYSRALKSDKNSDGCKCFKFRTTLDIVEFKRNLKILRPKSKLLKLKI